MEISGNKPKLIFAAILLALLLSLGTAGFMIIESFTFLESIYMTIITISTVGYGEVHELSSAGKIFTAILILLSLGVLAYVASIITTQLFEGQLGYFLRGHKNKSRLKKMKNHVIICGYGRNGQQAIKELEAHKNDFIVVDSDHNLILDNVKPGFNMIEGDATDEEVLVAAGLLTATPSSQPCPAMQITYLSL